MVFCCLGPLYMSSYGDTMNGSLHIPIKIPVSLVTLLEQVQQLFDSSIRLHHFVKVNKVQSCGFLSHALDTMFLGRH